jgi:hypothetical protein
VRPRLRCFMLMCLTAALAAEEGWAPPAGAYMGGAGFCNARDSCAAPLSAPASAAASQLAPALPHPFPVPPSHSRLMPETHLGLYVDLPSARWVTDAGARAIVRQRPWLQQKDQA